MNRRRRALTAVLAAGVLASGLAACGDDTASPAGETAPVELAPPASTPSSPPSDGTTPEPTATTGTPVPPPIDMDDDVAGAPAGERERAEEAAVAAVGGGEVVEVDFDNDDAAGPDAERWEIAVRRPDGAAIEVGLDRNLRVTSRERDDG